MHQIGRFKHPKKKMIIFLLVTEAPGLQWAWVKEAWLKEERFREETITNGLEKNGRSL
jgi:hypothetical protein